MKIFEVEDQTFKAHMRLSKQKFDYFCSKLREQALHENHPKGGPERIPLEKKVLLFLWYLANQNSFREISNKFNVSQGAAHNVVIGLPEQSSEHFCFKGCVALMALWVPLMVATFEFRDHQ